jgi:hypothetical protein
MTSESLNTFLGRTRYVSRPNAEQPAFRLSTAAELEAAQSQWDIADGIRLHHDREEADHFDRISRYETREEPADKALENRLRVAFLATKGATVKDWLEQRDAILAKGFGS